VTLADGADAMIRDRCRSQEERYSINVLLFWASLLFRPYHFDLSWTIEKERIIFYLGKVKNKVDGLAIRVNPLRLTGGEFTQPSIRGIHPIRKMFDVFSLPNRPDWIDLCFPFLVWSELRNLNVRV
jgi:hypothetical protein